jgi:hypothetical protein
MLKTVRPISWKSWQTQINKLSRTKQEVTRPLKLECDGLLCDLGTTQKSAWITEHRTCDLGEQGELG